MYSLGRDKTTLNFLEMLHTLERYFTELYVGVLRFQDIISSAMLNNQHMYASILFSVIVLHSRLDLVPM